MSYMVQLNRSVRKYLDDKPKTMTLSEECMEDLKSFVRRVMEESERIDTKSQGFGFLMKFIDIPIIHNRHITAVRHYLQSLCHSLNVLVDTVRIGKYESYEKDPYAQFLYSDEYTSPPPSYEHEFDETFVVNYDTHQHVGRIHNQVQFHDELLIVFIPITSPIIRSLKYDREDRDYKPIQGQSLNIFLGEEKVFNGRRKDDMNLTDLGASIEVRQDSFIGSTIDYVDDADDLAEVTVDGKTGLATRRRVRFVGKIGGH